MESPAHTSPLSSFIQTTGSDLPPRYIRDLDTPQIEALRHQKFHNRALHNPGLTMAEYEWKSSFKVEGSRKGRGPTLVWADSIDADFSCVRMDVYISSRYPEGSCPYGVILNHENQHVALNRGVFERYRALIGKALRTARTIPDKRHPIRCRSLVEGKNRISANISQIVAPLEKRFWGDLSKANATIDTPANYRRTQALCKNW